MYEIPKVLKPIRIGNVLLKNRIVSAPTTMHSLSNGELYPTEDAISFFESRARAGVGMVTVAGLKVGKDVADDGQNTAWDVNQPNHRNKLVRAGGAGTLLRRQNLHGAHRHFPRGLHRIRRLLHHGLGPPAMRSPGKRMEAFKDGNGPRRLGRSGGLRL